MTPPPERPDDFYVGYLPRAPRVLTRFIATATGALLAGGLGMAGILALAQRPPAPSSFEYGRPRTMIGLVQERPYPLLLVRRPGRSGAGWSVYLLAGEGKRGAGPVVAGRAGQTASFDGTLIYRGIHTMVELPANPQFTATSSPKTLPALPTTDLGPVRLTGEIVDGKCHLGAMNPGAGTTHRSCAVRCLRGGLPPLLVVRDGEFETELILAGPDGGPIGHQLLRDVAVTVQASGRLRRLGDWLILEASPESIRPLSR